MAAQSSLGRLGPSSPAARPLGPDEPGSRCRQPRLTSRSGSFKDTPLTTLFTIGRDNAAMTKSTQSSTMAVANTFAFNGIEAVLVEVQVQIAPGLPALILVGLPDKAVGEARERVRAAFAAMGVS